MKKILLVGCPNAGKSAVFNLLTGKNIKVANYSGVTVDIAIAELRSNAVLDRKFEIVDLPGIHSLCPHTEDEAVTVAALVSENRQLEDVEGLVVVLDFTRMESSLKLFLSIKRIWKGPIVVVVNKCDTSNQKERIKNSSLEKSLEAPVITLSALNDSPQGLDSFIREAMHDKVERKAHTFLLSQRAFNDFTKYFPTIDTNDTVVLGEEKAVHNLIVKDAANAHKLSASLSKNKNCPRYRQTLSVDQVLLHPAWGLVIFVTIFYLLFLSIYSWSAPFMDFIDYFVSSISNIVSGILPVGFIQSFVVDGVIAGMGASLVFLPQIFILFFLISILNQSGYISRASILTDHLMARFGLNGKAFLPFLSAFACTIPAIMATRTIKDRKERLATIMVLPFITCSARLPVYILLIGTFVPAGKVWGIFDRQALSFFFLYFLGTIVALVFAKIFRLSFFKGKSSSFIIELPHYQRPRFGQAFKEAVVQGKIFIRKVGTVILFFSMLIWVLSSFPNITDEQRVNKTEAQQKSSVLENSYMGRMGKTIEPLIAPLGFDWKMGVGIISAFAARELFVSTLGTIYALGDVDENSTGLRERILKEVNPKTGKPLYNMAVAWSLIIFFAFACQCMSTIAIVKRETESWKYSVYMFSYMLVFAYVSALGTYHLLI